MIQFGKFDWIYTVVNLIINFIWGIILAGVGFLADIRGSFHLMWITMLIDLLVGLAKSKWVNKEPFIMSKFLMWIAFVFLATALIALVYATEIQIIKDTSPSVYNKFALVIICAVIVSIIRNGEKITGKKVFTSLLDLIAKTVKRITSIDIKKYDK